MSKWEPESGLDNKKRDYYEAGGPRPVERISEKLIKVQVTAI